MVTKLYPVMINRIIKEGREWLGCFGFLFLLFLSVALSTFAILGLGELGLAVKYFPVH